MNLNFRLILGSNSPRRRELLQEMGYEFESVSINCDESYPPDIPLANIALFLAEKKAAMYARHLPENTVLITADTTVRVGNQLLEKPHDKKEAVEMLQLISGKKHLVTTGVCLTSKSNSYSFDDTTTVVFSKLSFEDIQFYIDNYKPFDKAGAYGIQEWIGMIGIKRLEGSYFNVVGLPTHKLFEALQNYSP